MDSRREMETLQRQIGELANWLIVDCGFRNYIYDFGVW